MIFMSGMRITHLILATTLCACSKTPETTVDVPELPSALEAVTVLVPAGAFIMGSDKIDKENKWREFGYAQPWFLDEHPQHRVNLPAFYIDRHEVTNAAFARFLSNSGRTNPRRMREEVAKQKSTWANEPVANITWQLASDYCVAAGKRLPTEAEWEKAARGTDGREYPWGDAWDTLRANAGGGSGVLPVESFPTGVSPFGVHDMAGNVAEWVSDNYRTYTGADFVSPAYGETHKVVRGGGWGGIGHYAVPHFYRAAYRDYELPDRVFNDIGFRCAKDADDVPPK